MKIIFLFLLTEILSSPAAANPAFYLSFSDTVYNAVEIQPQFQGGIKKAFEFIEKNLHYPETSFKEKIEGKVIVKFIVRSDGKTDSISILKGVNTEIDNEALRLVSNFPDWIPGSIAGKKVSAYYAFPISFQIKKPVVKTVLKTDTTHILVPAGSIPVIIDDLVMPEGFDVTLINFEYIDSGKFVEPYPLSKQDELIRLYGDHAKTGIMSLKAGNYDIIEFDTITNESVLYKGINAVLPDNGFSIYPGGKDEFIRYMGSKTAYPDVAKFLNLQEENTVRFIVDTLGKSRDFSFQKKGFYAIENQIVGALKMIESWKPAIKNGIKNDVLVALPFSFHLNKSKTENISFFNTKSLTGYLKPDVYVQQIKMPYNFDLSLLNIKKLNKSTDFSSNNTIKLNTPSQLNIIKTIIYYQNKDTVSGYPVYANIDTMPEFQGGKSEMYKYLGNNIKYPVRSQMYKESDEILITFVVMPTGEISDIEVVKGNYPILIDEAKRLVKKMPRWNPGILNGKPVAVRCKLPVRFNCLY